MAEHGTNIISSIKLPNQVTYEIHDAKAIHSLEELGLGSSVNLMNFRGVVAAKANLPTTGNEIGDVFYVTDTDSEWIWINGTTGDYWEELGSIHNHTHSLSVSGTVNGTNQASAVSVSGNITPLLNVTKKTVAVSAPTLTPTTAEALGKSTTFTTTVGAPTINNGKGVDVVTTKKYKVSTSRSTGVAVGANGTASAITKIEPTSGTFIKTVTTDTTEVLAGLGEPTVSTAVTGFDDPTTKAFLTGLGTPTTAAAITALNTSTVKGVNTITSVDASKVTTGSTSAAVSLNNASKETFSVANGVLTITSATGSGTVTVPTISVTPVTASVVTATNAKTFVTGSKTTANAITGFGAHPTSAGITAINPNTSGFVTGYAAPETVEVINTVSTTSGSALTGLGTPTTATVLTGVKVNTQPVFSSSIVEDTANGTTFVTGVSTKTITANAPTATTTANYGTDDANIVDAIVAVSASAPTVTNGEVVTAVTGKETAHTLSGTAAAQTWSGSITISTNATGGVKTNNEH